MKKALQLFLVMCSVSCMAVTCKKNASATAATQPADTSLVNTSHVDYLYTPFTFSDGSKAAGIYIYCNAPDYKLTADDDEGFTCVDDVARAVQMYVRNKNFTHDKSMQNKTYNLINFLLHMQSANGYFYNFVFPDHSINVAGQTSINNANWWSWRALYTLSEASPVIKNMNAALADKMATAVNTLIAKIKTDLIPLPQTTKVVSGITVPQWLPAGNGTDQAAIILLGLLPYAKTDAAIASYIKKLADGIARMQHGDANHFPFSCILSWENTWHAYGADQAYALMKAGEFLNDSAYIKDGLNAVSDFYTWVLQNGIKSSFDVQGNGAAITLNSEQRFDQIAYAIRPMVTAAAEAYRLTSDDKYTDIAGHLAAWFFGNNDAGQTMYSTQTGLCYDGIKSASVINYNSGAESTVEALLTMEVVEATPAIKSALNKYRK